MIFKSAKVATPAVAFLASTVSLVRVLPLSGSVCLAIEISPVKLVSTLSLASRAEMTTEDPNVVPLVAVIG